jgi:acyl carrier protein
MIEESIRRFIENDIAGPAKAGPVSVDSPLLESRILDSLGMFTLVGFLETEFAVEVADEELIPENFKTVQHIARLVESKR